MSSANPIKEIAIAALVGCIFIRHGKGEHQIWHSPITYKRFFIPHLQKKLPTGTLKFFEKAAGI
jgi:hypothetical protein